VIELELEGARVVFSTRRGGVSQGAYESLNLGILTDDEPELVRENRRRLAAAAELDSGAIAMGWQVHGAEIREWRAAPEEAGYAEPGAALPRVDGHATAAEGVGLLVLVADCLPLGLASGAAVAMLHCGWRGLAAGIVERGLRRFAEPPVAAIGPGIGPCCYEVGPEVLDAFSPLRGVARDGTLDLRAIVRRKLEAGGARVVEDVDICTSCRPDLFFSHRRDRGVTGRQAGLIWRPEAG
jgi:YfiH family protein